MVLRGVVGSRPSIEGSGRPNPHKQPASVVGHVGVNWKNARAQPATRLVRQQEAQIFAARGIRFSTTLGKSPRIKALGTRPSSGVGGASAPGRVGVNQVDTNRLFQERADAGVG